MVVDPPSRIPEVESRAALENIGHLTQKICGIWPSDELDTFLSRLVMDARDGERQGLPMPVAAELLFLAQANKMVRAMALGKKLSMDVKEAYRRIDEADQARLQIDPLDDPSVSRDTIISREDRAPAASAMRPASAASAAGGQAQGLGQLLLMLVRSKWLAWAIIIVLGVKVVWPMVKTLI